MKNYTYFLSYSWQARFQNGFRNMEITFSKSINSIEDIREIEAYIQKDIVNAGISNPSVQVINYQLLREEIIEECD